MPVSESANIAPIANELERLQPERIIELGIGGGLYGCIARNYLEGRHGRCGKDQWKTVIHGVEGFPQYGKNNPMWEAYDTVWEENFTRYTDSYRDYDLVMMIDSLEHVEKAEAMTMLYSLASNNKHVIVSVPLGVCPQGTCFGNELETHRSTWSGPQEFAAFNYRVLHQGVCLVVSIQGVK